MSLKRSNHPFPETVRQYDDTNPFVALQNSSSSSANHLAAKKQRLVVSDASKTCDCSMSTNTSRLSTTSSSTNLDNNMPQFSIGTRGTTTTSSTFLLDGQVVPKLDPNSPGSARRIQQRRRMISYGKNTIGYDEYMKQVPKQKRKPRFPKHPSTPDPTLDIPTRRFQGLVRAWRQSLHAYDPVELLTTKPTTKDCELTNNLMRDLTAVSFGSTSDVIVDCIKSKQIMDATQRGLLVGFCSNNESSLTSVVVPPQLQAADYMFGTTGKEQTLIDYEDESDDDLL